MSSERMKALSRLFLIVGLLLSVIVWYMIPAMTVKSGQLSDPVWMHEYRMSTYFWGGWPIRALVAMMGLSCVAKEFLDGRETLKLTLNALYVLVLVVSLMAWLKWLYGPVSIHMITSP